MVGSKQKWPLSKQNTSKQLYPNLSQNLPWHFKSLTWHKDDWLTLAFIFRGDHGQQEGGSWGGVNALGGRVIGFHRFPSVSRAARGENQWWLQPNIQWMRSMGVLQIYCMHIYILCVYIYIYTSIYLSIYLSFYLSIYLSLCGLQPSRKKDNTNNQWKNPIDSRNISWETTVIQHFHLVGPIFCSFPCRHLNWSGGHVYFKTMRKSLKEAP